MCSAFCLVGFLAMLLLWNEGIAYSRVGLAYARIGGGVGFAGTRASRRNCRWSSAPVPIDAGFVRIG